MSQTSCSYCLFFPVAKAVNKRHFKFIRNNDDACIAYSVVLKSFLYRDSMHVENFKLRNVFVQLLNFLTILTTFLDPSNFSQLFGYFICFYSISLQIDVSSEGVMWLMTCAIQLPTTAFMCSRATMIMLSSTKSVCHSCRTYKRHQLIQNCSKWYSQA